jgi:hypothetical protein
MATNKKQRYHFTYFGRHGKLDFGYCRIEDTMDPLIDYSIKCLEKIVRKEKYLFYDKLLSPVKIVYLETFISLLKDTDFWIYRFDYDGAEALSQHLSEFGIKMELVQSNNNKEKVSKAIKILNDILK